MLILLLVVIKDNANVLSFITKKLFMKSVLFTFLIILSSTQPGKCQILDSAFVKCTYELRYLPDSTRPEKVKIDILNLLIGKRVSTFYSYSNFLADSLRSTEVGDNPDAVREYAKNKELQKRYQGPGFFSYYQLFCDFQKKKIITTDKIISSNFIYEEDMENINWTILSDTLIILNFNCQKAMATFRGRNYEAWFTEEIPLSMGPFKFYGLPGLILKIGDIRNNYVYECIGVEKVNVTIQMSNKYNHYTKTTRAEFRKAAKSFFESPWESMTSGTNGTIGGQDADKLKQMLQKGVPYNPIELE